MADFKPSKYQSDIEDAFKYSDCNILVGAVAGSGKTTTMLHLLKEATGRVRFLAFNKSIVDELKERVPNHVRVSTMHSMGMGSIIKAHGNTLNINPNKTSNFIKSSLISKIWGEIKTKQAAQLYMILPRLVDIYRLTLCSNAEDLVNVASDIGIEFKGHHIQYAIDIIGQIEKYNQYDGIDCGMKEIDFTDMIHLPATNQHYHLPAADLWCIDESQDLSPCQHLLFKRARRRARFISVGDENQAIYGFAGADSNSFKRFLNYPNTKQFPLSICYRCPVKVVMHSNKIYDIMEAPEWARMGEVRLGSVDEIKDKNDIVICRNVKPLISVFFSLIKARKAAYIKGKDIGEGLSRLVRPYENKDLETMFVKLHEDLHIIMGELMERGIDKPRRHPRYVNFNERIEVLTTISETFETPRKLLNILQKMFSDSGTGICLSTGHKSKGLESKRVFFLDQHLLPSQYAVTPEQLKQEKNLKYVMTTRAQESLIYIYSDK